VWHEFDRAEYWGGRNLVAAFPHPLDERIRLEAVPGTARVTLAADPITRPEAVVTLRGQPIGPAGGLVVGPGELIRTGPHGGMIRTNNLSIASSSLSEGRTTPGSRS
jgi:hypothetical protein